MSNVTGKPGHHAGGKLERTSPTGQGLVQSSEDCLPNNVKQVNSAGISVYMPMTVNGVPAKLLIDTGAEVTLLSTKLYNSIRDTIRPHLRKLTSPVKIELADCGLVAVDGVVQIFMDVNATEFKWDAYVALIGGDGLLGMDFLYAHDFVLSANGRLQLEESLWLLKCMDYVHMRIV